MNDLIARRESLSKEWQQQCKRMVNRQISECNRNETSRITFVPSDNVYQFTLGTVVRFQDADYHSVPYLQIQQIYYYQNPALNSRGKSIKFPISVHSEKMYFMMTQKSGCVLFAKSSVSTSQNAEETTPEPEWEIISEAIHDLVYEKVEIRWQTHGYTVRDIDSMDKEESTRILRLINR